VPCRVALEITLSLFVGAGRRYAAIRRAVPAAAPWGGRAGLEKDGGNVWESNPPRTVNAPDKRI
jgi:hypothetical protein